ncbi:Peptidase family S41 [Candidatus Izimaplasma bacterium HR1]|jgi:hypothetical protein|uniref:InlB B-repeat-containing protein n=1 Tax=Candidatus Izimoplasma sp. HR1 TaxID=1541959 RepID=UPI0004F92576|nr:Peptidase family S41 [Candidatus Izimaplasma bacterium HR1]
MRKIALLLLLTVSIFTLSACDNTPVCTDGQVLNEKEVCVDPVLDTFTVTFNTNDGTTVASQEVEDGSLATLPTEPTKEGYTFTLWFTTDDTVDFDFTTPITADITINAYWTLFVPEITDEDLIDEDIQYVIDNLMKEPNLIDMITRGKINRSTISWSTDSIYISTTGIIIPLPKGDADMVAEVTATFSLRDTEKEHTFNITLEAQEDVVLATTRIIPFENLTTEYDVEDTNVDLMFEANGEVPYIKLTDFFDLLEGFIDPEIVFTDDTTDGILVYQYQYYDEDEDYTYDLILTVNSIENTISVNDPAFFWAYGYSIETNYGRHIEYMDDTYPGYDYVEGDDISYDLDEYNMDVVLNGGEVYLPYYIANQLFAGSSYYNVYYNYDGLYGIYAIPADDSDEMATIRTSSQNSQDIPVDMVIHNFNMIAFNLDTFYGLKDIKDVETFYTELYDRKDNLLSQDIADIEEELFDFIYKGLDDPHTSYRLSSFYNSKFASGPELTSIDQLGSRYKAMYQTDGFWDVADAIDVKWGTFEDRPDFWFLDSESVVISLDDFNTVDMEVSYTYDKVMVEDILEVTDADTVLPQVTQGSKFWYYKSSTLDENILELLIKDVNETYVTDYKAALVGLGATLITDDETTEIDYYSISVSGITYMIYVTYDTEYDILYINVVDEINTEILNDMDIAASVYSDNGVYLELVFDQIMIEQPLVENVLLDLTYNGGGNIGALYRVLGFITDEPYGVSKIDRDTYGYSTSYVSIDSGIPSYAHLKWSLLTTQVTYSAANELVAIFITEDLGDIIGMKTGGGACSITPVLLPSGTAFTMSSNSIGATRTGSGTVEDPYEYHNTEFGFEPDYALTLNVIYDEATLLAIINPAVE